MSEEAAEPPKTVELVFKNPSSQDDFRLEMALKGTTVRDVKTCIFQVHPEHPKREDQRLIFAGKLLADDASLESDVLKQHDVTQPQTFHLMTPRKASAASASPPTLPAQRMRSAPAGLSAVPEASAAAPTTPSVASPAAVPAATAAAAAATPATPAAAQAGAAASAPAWPPYSGAGAAAQMPMVQPTFAFAAVQPGLPIYQLMNGQCYQLVVREWNGQPFVVTSPVMPVYSQAPVFPGSAAWARMQGVAQDPAAAAAVAGGMPPTAAEAAAAAAAHPAQEPAGPVQAAGGAGMGAAGMANDPFGDEGEEGNTDSLKLLLKLALFVYILGQDGGTQRVLVLTAAAVAIFLAQTGRLEFLQRRLGGGAYRPPEAPPPPAAPAAPAGAAAADPTGQAATEPGASDDSAAPAAAAPPPPPPPPPPPSFLRDLENVVVTFFTSLLPSWPAGAEQAQAM